MVRVYETTFILKPDMEEEARESLITRIKGVITNNGGDIVEVDTWGSRKLAYEINNYKGGYYTLVTFESEPDVVDELERNYKIIDDVLRYLIVRKED